MNEIQIGHLLHSSTTQFVAGCSVKQLEAPSLGTLVRASMEAGYQVFGLITDIHIDDDGLVRQLVTSDNISAEVMRDNRERRIVPVEMSVLSVGYEQDGHIFHLLPPRPPLSLDVIYLCDNQEMARFTNAGHFGYFRHILRVKDAPVGELLAAHIRQAANESPDCIGLITWCHTFSPSKMWINGLKSLCKPLLHLNTQHNRDIPWPSIDMDFMNLNQAAHGDREHGFIMSRLRLNRKVVVGHWQEAAVQELITLLRDDYPTLMSVLGALSDVAG